jgi:DNA-binding MarR family transcriptional regulator
MSLFKKITSAARNRATYTAGMLQTRAYKILVEETSLVLAPLGISTTEWAMLGLLLEIGSTRPKHIAKFVGVEPPFVTVMATHLKKCGWVTEMTDAKDSRAKLLSITEKGKAFVRKTEVHVRNQMRPLVSGVSPSDLLGYLAVLESIIKNSET